MNTNNNIIDCRNKPCSITYENIIENFTSLNYGEYFLLRTTSNPKKLFYELLDKERGNFYWVPLKDGPNEWNVMIEKFPGF